jgi:hypothetical protein
MSLLNSFVDSFICVGFSSVNGVTVEPESKNNGSLFTSSLQPSVLAIVSGDCAMYPQSRGSEFIDPSYPPINRSSSQSSAISGVSSGRSTPLSTFNSSLKTQNQHIIPAQFNNLPFFCFPDGVQATFQRENEKIHHLVFTQAEGKRSYALALTFQQAFTLKTDKPDDDGTYQIDDVKVSAINIRRSSVSKIPVAVDKQKIDSQPSPPPTPTPTSTKTRSRKMPSSFHYSDTNSTNKSRSPSSNDSNSTNRSRSISSNDINPTSKSRSTSSNNTNSTSKPRSTGSNDTSKQAPSYATPTFSSYQKKFVV